MAKERSIDVVTLIDEHWESEEDSVNGSKLTLKNLHIDAPIHGFLQNRFSLSGDFIFVVLESLDNQLDYNQLYLSDRKATSTINGEEPLGFHLN